MPEQHPVAGMSSDQSLPTSDFQLLSKIDEGLWFATKRDDYRSPKYLAQWIGHFNAPGTTEDQDEGEALPSEVGLAFHDLMYLFNQAPVIAQIFNHENIISIVGHIQTRPVVDQRLNRRKDYIVWDFCDAANLSALFQDNPYQTPSYYLPESLCWHVLTSLMRAVTYLHDGKRLFFDPVFESQEPRKWLPVDYDWNPILHRAIEPRNIFFQHPRGIETDNDTDSSFSIAMAPHRNSKPLEHTRADMDRDTKSFTAENRPYTLADELWSIGSVVFTMMTGQQPILYCPKYGNCSHITTCSRGGCLHVTAAEKGCNCAMGGCEHIPQWRCTHEVHALNRPRHQDCQGPVINIDTHLIRARYSWRLRKLVKDLLDCDPQNRVRISKVLPFTKLVEEHYREWREETEEGMSYRDIEDDMMARWEAQRKMQE